MKLLKRIGVITRNTLIDFMYKTLLKMGYEDDPKRPLKDLAQKYVDQYVNGDDK